MPKKDYKQVTCTTCNGSKIQTCTLCGGEGTHPDSGMPGKACPLCKGTTTVRCAACAGNGYILLEVIEDD